MNRGVESTRILAENSLPKKVWLKQQFAIGVNDVTRVLERMAPNAEKGSFAQSPCAKLQVCFLVSRF
ncbi:hypothetical protein PTKIN_Ptkin15bG0066800 [Pterospermum kingtungense]